MASRHLGSRVCGRVLRFSWRSSFLSQLQSLRKSCDEHVLDKNLAPHLAAAQVGAPSFTYSVINLHLSKSAPHTPSERGVDVPEPLNLEELKTAARSENRRVIRRDGESGWRPLQLWTGLPQDKTVYYLLGDRVLAIREVRQWYTLR